MLIFSVFCLLRAEGPLKVEHVRDQIYKNQPHRIAAFADNKDDAEKYAGILYAKKQISAPIAIKAIAGNKFYIEQAHQTTDGWIILHSANTDQTSRNFESYIPSDETDWEQLMKTVSSTLDDFMTGYKLAYPKTLVLGTYPGQNPGRSIESDPDTLFLDKDPAAEGKERTFCEDLTKIEEFAKQHVGEFLRIVFDECVTHQLKRDFMIILKNLKTFLAPGGKIYLEAGIYPTENAVPVWKSQKNEANENATNAIEKVLKDEQYDQQEEILKILNQPAYLRQKTRELTMYGGPKGLTFPEVLFRPEFQNLRIEWLDSLFEKILKIYGLSMTRLELNSDNIDPFARDILMSHHAVYDKIKRSESYPVLILCPLQDSPESL